MRPLFCAFAVIVLFQSGLCQRNIASLPNISTPLALDNKVFFTASHSQLGLELFVTNGSTGNYSLVKDINPGSLSSSPAGFTIFNDQLFFTAYSHDKGYSLWKTDGTTAGTELIYNAAGADPRILMVFKDKLYFSTDLGSIMRTDGTAAGTEVFYQNASNYGRISTIVKNDNYIFFTPDGRTIYRDDGTSRISFLGPLSWEDVYFKHLFAIENGLVVIKSSTYDNVIRIYAISNDVLGDETEDEWVLIKKLDAPIYGSQEIENFTHLSGKLFFTFRTDYDNVDPTDELWVCDGTEAGTKLVKSFSWDPHLYQSESGMFFTFKERLFFRGGTSSNRSLWTSDGTTGGTVKFHDVIITTPYNDERTPVLVTEDKFFFSGTTAYNAEVWSSDGTAEGTQQLFDVEDDGGSNPHDYTFSNSVLFFVTSQQFSSTLWSSHPAADISVTARTTPIKSGTKPFIFSSIKPGSCQTVDLSIRNKGLAPLYLGNILVTGNDFYLGNQQVPEEIGPGESVVIQLVFNPVRATTSRGTLTILSNDMDEPRYVISLEGTTSNISTMGMCQFPSGGYVKSLDSQPTAQSILLSNSSVREGQPTGTVIGKFTSPANASFTLTAGEGDLDNQSFIIDGDVLKANTIFNFNFKPVYTLRVRAVSDEGETEASFRVRVINESFGAVTGECGKTFERVSFSYTALEANSKGHLFAATSHGKMIRSIDDGIHWEVLYTGYGALTEITFKGNIGIAHGTNRLLKSDDEGASWFPLYVPFTSDYYINSLATFFLDEHHGYVATEDGEVFFTDDGGHSWDTRLQGSWNEFRDLFFLSLDEGYATVGWGDLLKTKDGGRTWSAVDLSALGWSTRVKDLWFINSKDGFLVNDYKFYSTSDGGKTWIEIPGVSGDGFAKIKFYGKSIGYLFGGNGYMYRTADGGKNWDFLTPGVSPSAAVGIARAAGKLFIATKSYYYSYDAARAMAVSTDEGVSWSTLNYFSEGNLYQIDFAGEEEGVVIGEAGLFKTTDNGLTWNQTPMDLTPVHDVHFIDENTVILLSAGDLYKSTDGGATTRKVLTTDKDNPYVPAGKLFGFYDALFSVSWYAVYRSDDLGETWDLVSTDPGYYTQGMHFVSSTTGYRIELFGSVEKTVDGGKTWVNVFTREPTTSNVFRAIFFLNESLGYAGGDYLQRTVDGGVTWERINWQFYDILAIHFENEDHGYVVTMSGQVLETTDGGQTWQGIFSASGDLADVQFGNGEIYLSGANGFIARMNTTPDAPPSPGYIYGPNELCEGDAAEYFLAIDGPYSTQWSTTATMLEDASGRMTVQFPGAGEYTLTAKHFNSCGVSELRTTTVTVSAPSAPPVIEGPNPATKGEQDAVYTITASDDDSKYLWQVEGSTSASPTENGVVVDWSAEAESGVINVLAADVYGCRSFGTLPVSFFEVPLGIADDLSKYINVFPNPSDADIQIVSSYEGVLLVRIIDPLGREYLRTSIGAGGKETMQTRKLPAGLYFVEITEGAHTTTRKLIRK